MLSENGDSQRPGRRRKYTQRRAVAMETWVDEPLQNTIRDALDRRDWTISDLARKIDSQPSLISRWMQGQRPNTESLALIADALGLDVLKLLALAGHIPPGLVDMEDDRVSTLCAMLRQVQWTDERYRILFLLTEEMRNTPLTTPGVS